MTGELSHPSFTGLQNALFEQHSGRPSEKLRILVNSSLVSIFEKALVLQSLNIKLMYCWVLYDLRVVYFRIVAFISTGRLYNCSLPCSIYAKMIVAPNRHQIKETTSIIEETLPLERHWKDALNAVGK